MRVLDLFAGFGGWSNEARANGHEVFTVDWDPGFDCDLSMDIRELTLDMLPWAPDVVLASPPCETFSLMGVKHHWTAEGDWPSNRPKTRQARIAHDLVAHTLELIDETHPFAWVMENPVGKLRKLDVVAGRERRTVTYCQFGMPFRKQTDLWGGFPPSLDLPPPCHNGDACHMAAPRGSRTGTQGSWTAEVSEWKRERAGNMQATKHQLRQVYGTSNRQHLAAMRSKVPTRLARMVLAACEHDMQRA